MQMSASINFSCQPPLHVMKSTTKVPAGFWPTKTISKFELNKPKTLQWNKIVKREDVKKSFNRSRHFQVMSSDSDSSISPGQLSPSETINQFYMHINKKNTRQLRNYLSEDCCFEDSSFPKPFRGQKEVLNFFELLAASMGKDMVFSIEHICEGHELTVGTSWHLEWKEKRVPFTKGCSFFECSNKGDRLIIKKAHVIIESPIKPGALALALLKTVTTLFDSFPELTEWFLKRPNVVLQWLVKIYTILLLRFIRPILEGYIRCWKIMARLIGHAFNILVQILKIFFK